MARFLSFVVSITLAALVHVYTEIEAVKIGYTIRKQEEVKIQALDRGRALKYNIASLKAPHNLERRLIAQKILLESPRQWQTLVVSGGAKNTKPQFLSSIVSRPPSLAKFFVGTAQAEAKESSSR